MLDDNSITLWSGPSSGTRMLGHLAREASIHIAPLLRTGFSADGYVSLLLQPQSFLACKICGLLIDDCLLSIYL